MTLTCELVRDFSPFYVTKQKADICDNFPVVERPDTHTRQHTYTYMHLYQMIHLCMRSW